jgi:hypothetical protein
MTIDQRKPLTQINGHQRAIRRKQIRRMSERRCGSRSGDAAALKMNFPENHRDTPPREGQALELGEGTRIPTRPEYAQGGEARRKYQSGMMGSVGDPRTDLMVLDVAGNEGGIATMTTIRKMNPDEGVHRTVVIALMVEEGQNHPREVSGDDTDIEFGIKL